MKSNDRSFVVLIYGRRRTRTLRVNRLAETQHSEFSLSVTDARALAMKLVVVERCPMRLASEPKGWRDADVLLKDPVLAEETTGGHASSDRQNASGTGGHNNSRRRVGVAIGPVFLCLGPIVYFLSIWPAFLHWMEPLWPLSTGDEAYGQMSAVVSLGYWFVYARTLINTTSRKLAASQPKGKRNLTDHVDDSGMQDLADDRHNDLPSRSQINYFALSILSKRRIRRRVIDEFTPSRRTVQKTVSVEIDLNYNLLPSTNIDGLVAQNGHAEAVNGHMGVKTQVLHSSRAEPIFVALTTPKKGVLYDNLAIHDGNGAVLPSLSHREYRLLAGLTLRSFLRAAYGDVDKLPTKALDVEQRGLAEILRFAWADQRADESAGEYQVRLEAREDEVMAIAKEIAELDGTKKEFLNLAAELVWQLSQCYALVAILPGGQDRFIVRYVRTLVPHLRVAKLLSIRGCKDRLRMFLGARPVFLTVNARNAGTCQSYHLRIVGPPELYVGDFNIDPIVTSARDGNQDKERSYWRVQGRRGQHYFHLYTRALSAKKPNQLVVSVKFFEAPPGSLARAGAAAIATFIATTMVALAVSGTPDLEHKLDGQLAVFLLAAPGIAAAWLGFDAHPNLLLDGTLATRMSTVVTFFLAIFGSVVLLLNRAEVYPLHPVNLLTTMNWDLTWTLIVLGSFMNMTVTSYCWWQRSVYYQRIAIRGTDDSSMMPGD